MICNECVYYHRYIKYLKDVMPKNINDLNLMILLKYLHLVYPYVDVVLLMSLCINNKLYFKTLLYFNTEKVQNIS